jgi:hypothetical protein
MVVNFVRQHSAEPGVTVTESKFLHDASVDRDREVDIVVEGSFDGDPVVTSIEVIEHARPATIQWAEQIIAKHQHLPTNRLMLVSKSGFTSSALARVESEGGWVAAVTPRPVEVDHKPLIKSLFMDTIHRKSTAYRLFALAPDGRWLEGEIPPGQAICNISGNRLGTAEELAKETFHLPWLHERFGSEAHFHPERDQLATFECAVPLDSLGYYLQADNSCEFYPVKAVEFRGDFRFEQKELAFEFSDLGNRRYGFTEAPILNHPAIWVTSTDEVEHKTKLSWRTKDDKPLPNFPAIPAANPRFPELLKMQPPSDPDAPAS